MRLLGHLVDGIRIGLRVLAGDPNPTAVPQDVLRANPVRIAVLEHDLLGIQPEPGSPAALAIALRRAGTCIQHQPIEVTALHEQRRNAICAGCGASMVQNDTGIWELA